MSLSDQPSPAPRRRALGGAAGYLLAWVLAGAAATAGILGGLSLIAEKPGRFDLPPVLEPSLGAAVEHAGCEIAPVRSGSLLRPATRAERSPSVPESGVYPDPIGVSEVASALHAGFTVLRYRAPAPNDDVRALEAVQGTLPRATILTPLQRGGVDAVEVTGRWRRLVCPELDGPALDAVRLFHGRYAGRGGVPG